MEEAHVAYANLLHLATSENKFVCGQLLPQVLDVFANILDTELVTDELQNGIVELFQRMPAEWLSPWAQQLTPAVQAVLAKVGRA